MTTNQLQQLIDQHKRLGNELICHLRTRQLEVFEYLDHHLHEMSGPEVKMVVAMLLTGRTDLSPPDMAVICGIHENTVRRHILSKHVRAANVLLHRPEDPIKTHKQ